MISRSLEAQLEHEVQAILKRICTTQLGQMLKAPVGEVDFIASLIENGADLLQLAWQPILNPIKLRIGGVFCHSAPKVSVRGTKPRTMSTVNCELADLLVLHAHTPANGRTYRRAVLIQTKLDTGGSFRPGDPQFWLYDDWPVFSITGRGYNRRDRDFAKDRRSGLYGLVSNRGWFVTPPINPMAQSCRSVMDFGSFLVKMLYDSDPAQDQRNSMHGRQVYKQSKADWSQTIWDLIDVTARCPLVHRGSRSGNYSAPLPSRGGGYLAFLDRNSSDFIVPPRVEEEELHGDGGEGLSIFYISTEAQ